VNQAAYLDADAAALADREPRQSARRRPLTPASLEEMEFAVDLLRRADKAISSELAVLQGLNLGIDLEDVQRACSTLVGTAVLLHLRVQLERAGRLA
jgi:hypothetical protein